MERETCHECGGLGDDGDDGYYGRVCDCCNGNGWISTRPNLADLTPEQLGERWRTFCERHDRLVDCADIGDERIYSADQELRAIQREFGDRGLNYHDFTK